MTGKTANKQVNDNQSNFATITNDIFAILTDWCLVQLVSERLPPVSGSRGRDTQSEKNSKLEVSIGSLFQGLEKPSEEGREGL